MKDFKKNQKRKKTLDEVRHRKAGYKKFCQERIGNGPLFHGGVRAHQNDHDCWCEPDESDGVFTHYNSTRENRPAPVNRFASWLKK